MIDVWRGRLEHRIVAMRTRMGTLVGSQPERGDVPGWVLVAVMTAGLVTAIWLIADDALTAVLNRALSSVAVRN